MKKAQRYPWWLWPNLLGLDAPVIAVLWQDAFARAFGGTLEFPMRLGLFCATWVIYLGDRLVDGMKLKRTDGTAGRHQFAVAHPRVLVSLLLMAGVGAGYAACHMPRHFLLAAGGIGLSAGLYFLWNQTARGTFARRYFKEIMVALIFVMGVSMVPFLQGGANSPAFYVATGLFFLLCLSNCAMISRIERDVDIARGEESYAVHFSKNLRPARWMSLSVGTTSILLGLTGGISSWPFILSFTFSAIGLWFIPFVEHLISPSFAITWVEFCLMSPLLWLPLGLV